VPLKLIPPKPGRSPNYRIRGTYLGHYLDRSTETGDRRVASRLFAKWKEDIERGAYAAPDAPTFAGAALTYMNAGGERRFMEPLLLHFGTMPLAHITQDAIDAAAIKLLPMATSATRNRQVYSPVSAVLRRAGVTLVLRRPQGAQGTPRLTFLSPAQAQALLTAAEARNATLGALCIFLLYTGVRLSEALSLAPADVELDAARAFIRDTKNGDPLTVHLPPVVVAALANLEFGKERVFRLTKAGRLYKLFAEAVEAAGVPVPERLAFHIFRHTYGAWMRRFAGSDTAGLVATGRWKSRTAAAVYEHADVTEEAMKADMLPVGNPGAKPNQRK